MFSLVLVYVFNFDLFESVATILEKGLLKLGSVTLAAVYKSETLLLEGTSSIAKKLLHINIGVFLLCLSHRGTDQFSPDEIGRVILRIGPHFVSISSQTHIFHRLLLFSAESCFDPPSYLHVLR